MTEELRQIGVRRVLKKVQVYEVSPVMLGAGLETETLSVKAAEPPVPTPPADQVPRSAIMKELERFHRTKLRLIGR